MADFQCMLLIERMFEIRSLLVLFSTTSIILNGKIEAATGVVL